MIQEFTGAGRVCIASSARKPRGRRCQCDAKRRILWNIRPVFRLTVNRCSRPTVRAASALDTFARYLTCFVRYRTNKPSETCRQAAEDVLLREPTVTESVFPPHELGYAQP